MVDKKALMEFVEPYYIEKDIMHDLWHINLVRTTLDKILSISNYDVDYDCLYLATFFHGFIYCAENQIRTWLTEQGYNDAFIEKVILVSWESQRKEIPQTIEGKLLHDAHVLEGGKTYLVVKTLITGSVRGQSLAQTLEFMKENVLGVNSCYLPETISLCDEMNSYTEDFYKNLIDAIRE